MTAATFSNRSYAIAHCNFEPNDALKVEARRRKMPCCFLKLFAGDRLCIYSIENGTGWGYGYRLGSNAEAGLFPLNAVRMVERHTQNDQVKVTAEGSSLVEEINQVIQQWWTRIKEMYSKLTEVHYLDKILEFIDDLLTARKKITSGGVPAEELNTLRLQTARKIDRGNMLLSLNVTVRLPNGVPLDPESISVLQTYQEHKNAEKRVSLDMEESKSTRDILSVLLQIQSLKIDARTCKYTCEVGMVILDLDSKQFLTDTFTFLWKPNDQFREQKGQGAMFANITEEDCKKRLLLITRVCQISPIEGSSTMKKNPEVGPSSQFCRQVIAFDFLEMSSILLSDESPQEKIIFLEGEQKYDQCFKTMMSTGKVPKFTTSSQDFKLLITTQVFPGSAEDLKLKRPDIFNKLPVEILLKSEPLGVVNSQEPSRNEVYLCLTSAELLGGRSSDRNIEARLHVLQTNGTIVEDCFVRVESDVIKTTTDYRSCVIYKEDKPFWMEHIKIRLKEEPRDMHLQITFYSRKPYDKNKNEKGPFAIAFVRIMENAVLIQDGEYELCVYKVDQAQQFTECNTNYLNFPQAKRACREAPVSRNSTNSMFSLSEKSVVVVSTRICSSVFTKDENLLRLLHGKKWRNNPHSDLKDSLLALASPIGSTRVEMLRFLSPLLDALFEIWDNDKYELMVFDVIVAVFRLTDEPKNLISAELLKVYLERFPFCTAASKLIRCLNHYLESGSPNNDKTRNSLQVMRHIFSFIVRSRKSQEIFVAGLDGPSFTAQLESVLDSLVRLMSENRERMTVQNTALKHLPSIIDPICRSQLYSPLKLTEILIRVMRSWTNIVARERLGFVAQLIDTVLFEVDECRFLLLPHCLDQVQMHLDPEPAEKERDFVDRAHDCVSIVSSLLERLYPTSKASIVGPGTRIGTEEELSRIIDMTYRPIVHAMVYIKHMNAYSDDSRGRFFVLILALLNKMSAQIFGQYIESRPQSGDKYDFVMEMVMMIRDLLTKCPFPSTWQTLILQQNRIINKSLKFVMGAIQENFSNNNFLSDVWCEYMLTVVCFVTQPSLQATDEWLRDDNDPRFAIRKNAAKDLRSMWFRLSQQQKMLYVPKLVGSFLMVALLEDEETRKATIQVFSDMMICEYHSGPIGDFSQFTDELIVQLDQLVDQDRGSKHFQEQFTQIMSAECQSNKELWKEGGRDFIKRVDQLMGHLFEYRLVRETADCVENGMSRTVQLIRYYAKYHHDQLHISYVYKLYQWHIVYHNEIEAASTLLLYADTLTWEDKTLPDYLLTLNVNEQCATERQLKDKLMNKVADLFAEGEMWEDAIQILRELIPVYECMYVDYTKLSDLLTRIAGLFKKINKENRAFFVYYHVAFYGKAFPPYLNGHKFVFRSDKLERLGDFVQRMKQMYGGPEEVKHMDDCSELADSPGRYIQVFQVDPIGAKCPFENDDPTLINPAIVEFYNQYHVNQFEFQRLAGQPDTKWTAVENSDLMRKWMVIRKLDTEETLPSILRFSEIKFVHEAVWLSPLRSSVRQMELKNKSLLNMASLVLRNPLQSVMDLSGSIWGVIRADVQGGVRNFEIFFQEACSQIYDAEEKCLAMDLSGHIIKQVEIIEYGIYAYATRCRSEATELLESIVTEFLKHRTYVENTFGKTGSMLPQGVSISSTVANLEATEREKKTASTTHLVDMSYPGTLTIATRKHMTNVLSRLTPAKKSSNGLASVETINSPSSPRASIATLDDPQRSPIRTLTTPTTSTRRFTAGSFEGIRLRNRITVDTPPPPLPPRN